MWPAHHKGRQAQARYFEPVNPPPKLPDEGWNCAGCAFREYKNIDLGEVKKRLSKCRKLASCSDKCKAGECKFWLWEYDSEMTAYGEAKGKRRVLKSGVKPLDPKQVNPELLKGDFHIVGGNVDPKTGEDLPNVPSKMGGSQCRCKDDETDYGSKWKPKSEEEVDRVKDLVAPGEDLVAVIRRINMQESCYCCPHMK